MQRVPISNFAWAIAATRGVTQTFYKAASQCWIVVRNFLRLHRYEICASRFAYLCFGSVAFRCVCAFFSSPAARKATSQVLPRLCWYLRVSMLMGRQQSGQYVWDFGAERHGAICICSSFWYSSCFAAPFCEFSRTTCIQLPQYIRRGVPSAVLCKVMWLQCLDF